MQRAAMYLRYGNSSWDLPDPTEASVAPVVPRPARRRHHKSRDGNKLPTIDLDGVELHAVTEQGCISYILDELDSKRGGVVVTPNLDHVRRCRTDVHFAALVAEADLVVADGMPLVWASRLQGTPLPERVAGSNLISTLSAAAAGRGRSIFLLGGDEGTADGAAKILTERHPSLRIAGTFCPPPGFERNAKVMKEMTAALASADPDIVYVALGSPKQERLIASLRRDLPNAWWLGVGISFSFICGHVRRAPGWMQTCGVEWVHRLLQEPRRLFKRYILTGLPFAAGLMGRAAMKALPNRLGRPKIAFAEPSGGNLASKSLIEDPKTFAESGPTPARLSVAEVRPANGNGAAANGHARIAIPSLSPDDSAAGMTLLPIGADPRAGNADGPRRLSRLRAVVLLGGSVRPSELCATTDRSVLDMPLNERGTLLNDWLENARGVAEVAGLAVVPVRLMVSQSSPEPMSADEKFFGAFRVERDRSEYRGTGGVLKDVAADYADEDLILVANAAQILLDPLAALAVALDRKGGDVALVSHEDGTPSGVMLLTCKALRLVPAAGFVDMKEQVLPEIAARFDVRVVRRRRPTGLPARTREEYIEALRVHHRLRSGKPAMMDPLAEDWSPAFSLVEAGATVDSSARIHDSVVLAGATVEPGAVLVRTLVCPGAVVRRDRTAVDACVERMERPKARPIGLAMVPSVL